MSHPFPPAYIRKWMNLLRNGAQIPKQTMLGSLKSDEQSLALEYAINMGILVVQGKGMHKAVSFCQKLKSIPTSLTDRYCFECNLPGALRGCKSCSRSFHESCQRKHPEKPTYGVPSDKGQSYRFPPNESDTDVETASQEEQTEAALSMENHQLDHNSNINTSPIYPFPSVKCESPDWDDNDVSFVSEKPAARQRKSKVKTEPPIIEPDSSSDLEKCTACRLMTQARIRHPPHLNKEELRCLLRYSWNKHQSWLTADVDKYMTKHYNNRDRALVRRILFKTNTLGQADIERSIEGQKYEYLTEFLVDLLDLQHNIGVFFGPTAREYKDTRWLLRDVTHDIREIRRCPDCFRNSNQTECSMWFAKPCLQRHEVVFAKQAGSPHWPAKVISVSSKTPIKYDVRFFGTYHLRASVLEKDIIPIEGDVPFKQKAKISKGMAAAMKELTCHTLLAKLSPDLFSFHANPADTKEAIDKALSHCLEPTTTATPGKRARRSTPGVSGKMRKISATTPAPTRVMPQRRCSMSARLAGRNEERNELEDLKSKLSICENQLLKSNEELDSMRKNIAEIKRKRWCQKCLQEAKLDCCFNASYCSEDCQRRHKKRHQRKCTAER
ncbi:protein kinase C-binding protein 1 [Drosophila madeirensis]|uniref:Protein kinase C-binding protein 1 n=1 Tax=Drosophila madeirensis TaxID=30013 RepID=A0AAU9GBC5_DROMD